MISATIVTYNEAEKLKSCLKSINGFVDEMIVVDLGSTDHTPKIAKQFKAKLVAHPFVPYVELVRNFAIEQCSGDWILILDPDERLPNQLKKYLMKYVKSNNSGVVNIPRKNVFFGKWIAHTNFWPDHQIRFFSKGAINWQSIIHSYPITFLPVTKLPPDEKYAIEHVTYPTYSSFIKKQTHYAHIRAKERYDAGEKASIMTMLYFSVREILSRYIKHKGYLDKKWGLLLVLGLVHYWCMVEWKLKQLEWQAKRVANQVHF